MRKLKSKIIHSKEKLTLETFLNSPMEDEHLLPIFTQDKTRQLYDILHRMCSVITELQASQVEETNRGRSGKIEIKKKGT